MQLGTILCEFEQICALGNALMQLGPILCKLGQICITRNTSMQLKGYMSLDGYVKQERLCSWKQFYASLDKSVLQGILFSD